jgi:glycogen debranching enzyme
LLRIEAEICRDPNAALSREWLETNGLGGFASSTVAGLNTRRYHGLLVAALRPPVGRFVLLSKLEETLVVGGRRFELSANRYPGVIHPQGYLYLKEFRLDPCPVFVYQAAGIELEKRVYMVNGENTTVIEYAATAECALEVRPLIAFRDFHSTTHWNNALDGHVSVEPGLAKVAPYPGLPALFLAHNAGRIDTAGAWYYNFEYDRERERGLDYREDLFNPLCAVFHLDGRRLARIVASTERHAADDAALRPARAGAADRFLVRRGSHASVIAGYHWFADWGRDTMIALPGLALASGRREAARDILKGFAQYVDQGMLPNRFPEAGETPEYNTVDATLWYFEAVRVLAPDAIESLYPVLAGIIDWHIRGTRYGIRRDSDGLIACGEQLTWMDARVGGRAVTPRKGKPVEIQALWYNALRVMEQFGGAGRYADLADQARSSFNRLFWNDEAGCLYDVVDGGERDASIRPNQVIAVSLPYTMLPAARARGVVEAVRRDLLTPYGLRTLAPGDPRYRPRYEGDVASRDSAYHQGTVWPWLMGPFLTAYLKVNGYSAEARRQAAAWLEPLQRHLGEAGLGQVSEIFDGDPPHRPRGCIAQAWSVGELARAAAESGVAFGGRSAGE